MKLIILGLSPTGKYVAKESYQQGIPCYGFDRQKGTAYYSKYFKEVQVVTEEQLLQVITDRLLPTGDVYMVCATSDEWVKFIAEQKVFRHPNMKVCPGLLDGSYHDLADKARLEKLAGKLGLHYPVSLTYIAGDVLPGLEASPFPLFCKPADRSGLGHVMKGKKGWIINRPEDLEAVAQLEPLRGTELLIQEIIEGPEYDIKVLGTVSHRGVQQADEMWTGAKVRQYPPGFGSASFLCKEDNPELAQIAQKLIDATGYQGFFALEVKYCRKRGRWYLIEINTRPSLWFGATTSSNYQLVSRWMNEFGGNQLSITPPLTGKGVHWKYLYKDRIARLRQSIDATVLKYEKQPGVIRSYAVWDRDDPKPFAFDFWNGISKLFKRSF